MLNAHIVNLEKLSSKICTVKPKYSERGRRRLNSIYD